MKTFIVEVIDNSKAEFVETLLSQLEGINFRQGRKTKQVKQKPSKKKTEKTKSEKQKPVGELFSNSFGMWKDRNIDAKELRKKAWRNK